MIHKWHLCWMVAGMGSKGGLDDGYESLIFPMKKKHLYLNHLESFIVLYLTARSLNDKQCFQVSLKSIYIYQVF